MAAIDFPDSPAENDDFTFGGVTYIYQGGVWVGQIAVGAPGAPGTNGVDGIDGDDGAPGPTIYPGPGMAVSDGSAWLGSKTTPSGAVLGTTDTQTVTNKTLGNYTETVFAVTGTAPALSPVNGPLQTWALTAASTPTAGTWAAGQSMVLHVDDGTAFTINWGTVNPTWVDGAAPTLKTTGYTVVTLWKIGSTIYGTAKGA